MPKSIGYHDVGISAVWDLRDEHMVDKMLHKIRNQQIPADTFENKLMRYYNDQSTDIEPIIIGEPKTDLVVNNGLIRIAQLVVGKSNAVFNSYASGTGTSVERASDSGLSNENWRVSLLTSGYAEAMGTTMRFAGKFPTTMPGATITEGGVFDTGAAFSGTMLFRTLYPSSSFAVHIEGRDFVTLTQSINQVSIT